MPIVRVSETITLTGCSRGGLCPGDHSVPDDVAQAAIAAGATLVEPDVEKPKKRSRKRTATDKAAETAEKAVDE